MLKYLKALNKVKFFYLTKLSFSFYLKKSWMTWASPETRFIVLSPQSVRSLNLQFDESMSKISCDTEGLYAFQDSS